MLLGVKRSVALLVLSGLGAWPSTAPAGSPLEERVDSVIQSRGFESGQWGLLVVDSATGKTVYERNADRMFCPASVTKLFSTAAALVDLGPDHRFKTPVVRRGEISEGVLRGDLILVAKGDLSLGGRTGPDGTLLFEDNDHSYAGGNPSASLVTGDPLAGLTHLAREVQAAGIKSISGDILVDDRLFEHAMSTGSGPSKVAAIVVNDNVIDVLITPGARMGDPARVRIVPETDFVTMDARVSTTSGEDTQIEVHAVGPRRFTVRGRIPVGSKPVLKIYEVEEPAAFARTLFIETLRNRGISVGASPLASNLDVNLPSKAEVAALPVVAEYTSPPLREYLKVILKVSQNLHASTLPLLVAANHGETTLDRGLKREGEILSKLGVDVKTISFGGGAGGSRSDLVTPRATVALLRAMSARPDFAAYDAALPVLGRDGTLAKAVSPESPAKGHVRAKTGTYWVDNALDGHPVMVSKALAGYLETASGRKLTFAFFVNNVPLEAIGGNVPEASITAGRRLARLCEVFYADTPESGEVTAPTTEPVKTGR
jgi:D-alanyl-D-alanine carboxypeptidase/D-alanyl-D-alanine-endopeptidase (penicillin-binding protein 4)